MDSCGDTAIGNAVGRGSFGGQVHVNKGAGVSLGSTPTALGRHSHGGQRAKLKVHSFRDNTVEIVCAWEVVRQAGGLRPVGTCVNVGASTCTYTFSPRNSL